METNHKNHTFFRNTLEIEEGGGGVGGGEGGMPHMNNKNVSKTFSKPPVFTQH